MNYQSTIKKIRKSRKETRREIANILGVSVPGYTNYENGYRKMPISYLIKLANYWNLTLDELVGRSSQPLIHQEEDKVV